jgi:hypothetical protein
LLGLAVLVGLLGVVPGLALMPASGWTGATTAIAPLGLRTGFETPGYASLFVVALFAIVWIVLVRLRPPLRARREPAWSGGFAPSPPWMPFGDPATQLGATFFVAPLRAAIALLPSADPVRQRLIGWRDSLRRVIASLVPI